MPIRWKTCRGFAISHLTIFTEISGHLLREETFEVLENHNSYCISRMFLRFCHLTKGPVFSHVDSSDIFRNISKVIWKIKIHKFLFDQNHVTFHLWKKYPLFWQLTPPHNEVQNVFFHTPPSAPFWYVSHVPIFRANYYSGSFLWLEPPLIYWIPKFF